LKLKFKQQPYQTDAVQALVEWFAGQPNAPAPVFLDTNLG
jgi:hypothetical protein